MFLEKLYDAVPGFEPALQAITEHDGPASNVRRFQPTSEIRNSALRRSMSLEFVSTIGALDTATATSSSDHPNVTFKYSTLAAAFFSLRNATA